jgi:hypothetical protein
MFGRRDVAGLGDCYIGLRRDYLFLLNTGVKIPAERSGCDRVEGDFVAQPFQMTHKTTLDELTIPFIEVIVT